MRAVLHSVAALALLGLTACGSDPAPPPKTETKKAAKPAKPAGPVEIRFAPGRWESTMKLEKLDMGNVPPQVRQVIEAELGKEQKFAYCLSPEEAAQPGAKFFNRDNKGDCTYDEYTAKGGRIDVKMSCPTPQGSQKVTLAGTYAADTYSMTMSSSGDAGMGVPMLMTMSLSSRRVGSCTGDEGR
jgi:hypothetical protein